MIFPGRQRDVLASVHVHGTKIKSSDSPSQATDVISRTRWLFWWQWLKTSPRLLHHWWQVALADQIRVTSHLLLDHVGGSCYLHRGQWVVRLGMVKQTTGRLCALLGGGEHATRTLAVCHRFTLSHHVIPSPRNGNTPFLFYLFIFFNLGEAWEDSRGNTCKV